MTAANCRLSLIILNHNAGTLLYRCFESLFAHSLPDPMEIILVDNASDDASVESVVERWGARIQVLRNDRNGGFAWGNNIGIRASSGNFVCLLNPDTVVHEGTLVRLVEFLETHPRAGFAGPKVLNSDGSFQLSAKRSIPTPFDAIARALHVSHLFPNSRRLARYNLTYLDPDTTQQVDASSGCCIVARRSMLDAIGLLDEEFFIYCEDVDWFLRAKKAGWEAWYIADVVLEHHHAYSARFRRHRAVFDFHRSMLRFYAKHYAGSYPRAFNVCIRAGVWARMGLIMGRGFLNRWQ